MGAGLLLAGVAGAAVVHRRKGGRELPELPGETQEHAALRAILTQSAAYNDALYERVQNLEKIDAPSERMAAVAQITTQNQAEREAINGMRAALQGKLDEQGRTFMDVDGFVELLSEYRGVTLAQQKRHMVVYQRVRKLAGVPDSPELHAYMKLGFKDDAQRWADTDMQLMKVAAEQREIMLRAGRVLDAIADASAAVAAAAELNELGSRYTALADTIRLYRDDDPKGALHAVDELRTMYAGLLPMLKAHASRLREQEYYGSSALREVLERMLPQG